MIERRVLLGDGRDLAEMVLARIELDIGSVAGIRCCTVKADGDLEGVAAVGERRTYPDHWSHYRRLAGIDTAGRTSVEYQVERIATRSDKVAARWRAVSGVVATESTAVVEGAEAVVGAAAWEFGEAQLEEAG